MLIQPRDYVSQRKKVKREQEELVTLALDAGFSHAARLDAATLAPLGAVRDMCAADTCQLYGRCWTCPPACGTIQENADEIAHYRTGLIVQTTRTLEDPFDYEGMMACGEEHRAMFLALRRCLRAAYPGLLALGAGGCRQCEACTYPSAPCRRPEEALSSMEAYGLLVSDVCRDNGLGYYYGPGTMTYTGCFLLA